MMRTKKREIFFELLSFSDRPLEERFSNPPLWLKKAAIKKHPLISRGKNETRQLCKWLFSCSAPIQFLMHAKYCVALEKCKNNIDDKN